MVRRYTKDRMGNLDTWALGALEDITLHTLWELDLPFMDSMSTSYPSKMHLYWLRELFPGVADDDFSLHREISIHGGSASDGDVVSFYLEGSLRVGELLETIGIRGDKLYSYVSVWDHDPKPSDNASWATYKVEDHPVRVCTSALDAVLCYRMAGSGKTAVVYIPYELRVGT